MQKLIIMLLGCLALGLMSCMVVVNEEDGCHKQQNDSDTVTVIFSQTHTGTASGDPMGR